MLIKDSYNLVEYYVASTYTGTKDHHHRYTRASPLNRDSGSAIVRTYLQLNHVQYPTKKFDVCVHHMDIAPYS